MTNTLIGLFNTSDAAQKAVQDLIAVGIDRASIGTDASRLTALGVPSAEATRYAQRVQGGNAIVTVQAEDGLVTTVTSILDRDGALDLDGSGDKIEIVEEQLQVGKREVERGGVKIRSFVTEKAVSEQITLREEHVDVQRTKVDRPAGEDAFATGTIEMRETAEVPVVAKEARVVEEISLGKTTTERTETVSDTVRRTDVEIVPIAVSGASATTAATTERAGYQDHLATVAPDADYDRHAPAYAYGEALADHATHGATDFDASEDTHKETWEAKNPGTWDEFKASVKHAFESVKKKV